MMLSEKELMFIIISSLYKEDIIRPKPTVGYNKTIYHSLEFISLNISKSPTSEYG